MSDWSDDVTIKWNDLLILGELTEPFYRANELLGRAFQEEITDVKWPWPRETHRKSKVIAGSPRAIVDLGGLRDSYNATRGVDAGDAIYDHEWVKEYAMFVHEGAVLRNGTALPERPWTDKPLKDGVLTREFIEEVHDALERIQ